MEQYEIPTNRYFENIQKALKHFQAKHIFIRFMGSLGGKTVFNEKVKDKKLSITREKYGIWIKINGKKSFFYEIKKRSTGGCWGSEWSIAYRRFYPDGKEHLARGCYPNSFEKYLGPKDPRLPEVKQTIFRVGNESYLLEITFSVKIPIKKVSLIPGYKDIYYWEIDLKQ